MPSVSASWMTSSLLPQALRARLAAAAARRVNDFVESGRIRRGMLSGRNRGPVAALAILLEDRAQTLHRAGVLAPQPAARAERLADLVGEQLRLALEGERDPR